MDLSFYLDVYFTGQLAQWGLWLHKHGCIFSTSFQLISLRYLAVPGVVAAATASYGLKNENKFKNFLKT